MAIVIVLELRIDEQQEVLRKYGYCLSESVAADMIVLWFSQNFPDRSGKDLLNDINEVLEKMGLPLLMTRIR